jgi:hypothetical protein
MVQHNEDDPSFLGDIKTDPDARSEFALRGVFATLEEAKKIAAASYERPRYIAWAPNGRFSIFKMRELPWGDCEGDSAELWPLEQTIVYLPPTYEGELATAALKAAKIGPK